MPSSCPSCPRGRGFVRPRDEAKNYTCYSENHYPNYLCTFCFGIFLEGPYVEYQEHGDKHSEERNGCSYPSVR